MREEEVMLRLLMYRIIRHSKACYHNQVQVSCYCTIIRKNCPKMKNQFLRKQKREAKIIYNNWNIQTFLKVYNQEIHFYRKFKFVLSYREWLIIFFSKFHVDKNSVVLFLNKGLLIEALVNFLENFKILKEKLFGIT